MSSTKLTRLFLRYCRGMAHPCKFRLIALAGRWVLPAQGMIVTLAEGFDMRLQVMNHLERCLVVRGDYEPLTTRFVRANVRPGDVTAVAGANIGYYPLLLAAAAGPTGRVLGIEPFPGNMDSCQRNLELNPGLAGSITLFAGAIGRQPDMVRLAAPPADHTGLAQLRTDTDNGMFVRVERFADLAARLLPRRPDLMVLDIEGWEAEALAGFGPARPDLLLIENDPRHQAERGLTEAGYFELLARLRYSLAHFDGRPARPGDFYPEQTLVAWQPGVSPVWL
jgi:FkbM family methyltransferase